MAYLTRRGAVPRPAPMGSTPPPYIEAVDDGAVIVGLGDVPLHCLDCSGRGRLAEAGAIKSSFNPTGKRPWLRICDLCGAHWDVSGIPYYLMADDSIRCDVDGDRQAIGFGGGLDVALHLDERVCTKNGAPTHRAILESVPSREMERLVEAVRKKFRQAHNFFEGPYVRVPLPGYWGRRARFHPVTTGDVPIDLRRMTPESILAYFERLSVECAFADVWAEGAEATREWIELTRAKGGSQERVSALLARVRDQTPSMFYVLRSHVEHWAHAAGWRVT